MVVKAENILDDLIVRVARVRYWLVALGVLKTAAIGLAGLCLYVGLYAWIDHHAHFGHAARLCALLVLLALLAVLGYLLVRALKRSMTYAHAANYVENRRSFDQQLVAAVEYFERKEDYPYSRTLAEQLVLQVDEAAQGFRFDSVIKKWQGYMLAGLIALGLCIVGLFVQQNVSYFAAYLSRLFRPLAKIEPVPATVLESVTQDLVVARDTPVTLTAAIAGRTPESATVILTRGDPNDPNAPTERVEVRPTVDSQNSATLTTTRPFDKTGQFTYRFQADGASSEVHTIRVCEPPSIKSMTATVSLPRGQNGPAATATTQQIKDGTLEVPPHSVVELQVESTAPLREASATMPGGQPAVQNPGGTSTFGVRFSAEAASAMEFKLTSADGIASREPQQLRVVLKGDEPPQFKLLCPEGDCQATDVASIPITFEVTDDFGLGSLRLYCELPNRGPTLLDSKAVNGAKTATLTHTLELEQYDLRVGDSILFYARASDIRTGPKAADANACSEIYFIEIRPYRQYWHPVPGGPSSAPGAVPEDLITILEYTRAILKKTWALANEPQPTPESASRFNAIGGDVEYCGRQLAHTRDDPENGFSESDKAALSKIGECYTAAGDSLRHHDAGAALPAVRDAYRLLRRFIDERHLKWIPPQSGPSVPQDAPERIKLQEEPQGSGADQQRVENQLEKLQRKIESLARQQKSLSSDLNKAMQQEQTASREPAGETSASQGQKSRPSNSQSNAGQQTQAANAGQPDNSSSPSAGSSGQPSSGADQKSQKQSAKNPPTADQNASRQARDDKQSTGSSQAGKDGDGQAAAKGRAAQGASASKPGPSKAGDKTSAQQGSSPTSSGTPQDNQGHESSSAGDSKGGKEPTGRPSSSSGSPSAAQDSRTRDTRSTGSQGEGKASTSTDAQLRMLEAKQKALREQASQVQAELQQLPAMQVSAPGRAKDEAKKHMAQAVDEMKEFEDKLTQARYESSAAQDKPGLSAPADSAGRELTEAGRAIRHGLAGDKTKTATEQAQEMAEQLAEDAEALDESLSAADRQRMLERLEAVKRLLQSNPDPQWSSVSSGGSASGTLVYTKGGPTTPAETARMLARQLWSKAIEARQKEVKPFMEQPSDVEFFQAEKEFFEKAAQFNQSQVEK
jgi:hypothetical protein